MNISGAKILSVSCCNKGCAVEKQESMKGEYGADTPQAYAEVKPES
jgi:hypothetical protein